MLSNKIFPEKNNLKKKGEDKIFVEKINQLIRQINMTDWTVKVAKSFHCSPTRKKIELYIVNPSVACLLYSDVKQTSWWIKIILDKYQVQRLDKKH